MQGLGSHHFAFLGEGVGSRIEVLFGGSYLVNKVNNPSVAGV